MRKVVRKSGVPCWEWLGLPHLCLLSAYKNEPLESGVRKESAEWTKSVKRENLACTEILYGAQCEGCSQKQVALVVRSNRVEAQMVLQICDGPREWQNCPGLNKGR